jgi:hypothetical protein
VFVFFDHEVLFGLLFTPAMVIECLPWYGIALQLMILILLCVFTAAVIYLIIHIHRFSLTLLLSGLWLT